MKMLTAFILATALAVPGMALAQGAPANANNQANAQPNTANQHTLANAQKIKQDLQNAGFKDVNVVAESFVVQAKTKDGDPIVMTIGPHGMTVFEAVNIDKSAHPNTTGSTASSGSGTSGNSSTQK